MIRPCYKIPVYFLLQDKAWKENLDCENHKIFIRTNREKRKKMEEEEEKKSSVGEKKEERQTNSVGGEEEETLTSLDQGEGGGKEIAIA